LNRVKVRNAHCVRRQKVRAHIVRILFLFWAFPLAQARSDYFICFGGLKNVHSSQGPPQRFILTYQ
jgi:hypothetical protein